MRRSQNFTFLFSIIVPTTAAADPSSGPIFIGNVATEPDQWQRIDFRSARLALRTILQIRITIQTKGPRILGLIRIPGAPASNFDTGKGTTAVDLMTVGDRNEKGPMIVHDQLLRARDCGDAAAARPSDAMIATRH
jgi:hypothetical protein